MNTFLVSPRRTPYLLLSHVLGRASTDGLIPNRVRREQAMAKVLGCGLCAPLHIKTLKALTGVSTFPSTSYQFVKFLTVHARLLCRQGPVVLVIDDLPDLRARDLDRFCGHLQALMLAGVEVLLAEPFAYITRLRTVQWLMSVEQAVRLHVFRLQRGEVAHPLPTAVYFAPVRRRGKRSSPRILSSPIESEGATPACA